MSGGIEEYLLYSECAVSRNTHLPVFFSPRASSYDYPEVERLLQSAVLMCPVLK